MFKKFDLLSIHKDDVRFCVNTARLLAARSRATRARVGAVIWNFKKRTIVGIGYNGTPVGHDNTMEVNNKTLPHVIHAEVNAIHKVNWFDRRNSVIIVTHAPCKNCAVTIASSGIKGVLYLEPYGSNEGLDILKKNDIPVLRILE